MKDKNTSNPFQTMDNCPIHFYRYRSLAGGAAEFVERTICHDELYFPKPASFNDPFDCRPIFSFEATKEGNVSCIGQLVKTEGFNLDKRQYQELEKMLSSAEQSSGSSALLHMIQMTCAKKLTQQTGILCLSGVRDDILMWSHYADSHRGICLEFDSSFSFFTDAQEVTYWSDRPKVNPFRQSHGEMLEASLLSKSEQWCYEREWRIVDYKEGSGIRIFPAEALTGVILGAEISKDDTEKIIRWIQHRELPLKLYRAAISHTSFSLDITEISS